MIWTIRWNNYTILRQILVKLFKLQSSDYLTQINIHKKMTVQESTVSLLCLENQKDKKIEGSRIQKLDIQWRQLICLHCKGAGPQRQDQRSQASGVPNSNHQTDVYHSNQDHGASAYLSKESPILASINMFRVNGSYKINNFVPTCFPFHEYR